jgi:sec-independent protein translocase protein TatA
MGGTSIWHWLVVGVIVMLLFGRGKISEMMGDVAKGIKAFKKGMTEEEAAAATPAVPGEPVRTIEHQTPPAVPSQPAPVAAQPATAAPAAPGTPLGERKVG